MPISNYNRAVYASRRALTTAFRAKKANMSSSYEPLLQIPKAFLNKRNKSRLFWIPTSLSLLNRMVVSVW